MAEVEDYAKAMIDLYQFAEEFENKFRSIGGRWAINQVVDSYLSLFDRFCPYSVGDRVELVKDVDVSDDSGWFSCRHFLKAGAKATVVDRGYRNQFTFHIVFDDETWIDREGKPHPVKDKGRFYFAEHWLVRARP